MATNTTSARKFTKADRFNQLLALEAVQSNPDLVKFVKHELELLASKNGAKKPTAHQMENEKFKEAIDAFLTDHSGQQFTITDLWKNVPALASDEAMTSQRVNAMVRQMIGVSVNREVVKGKAMFSAM